jgi:hypothetical protein
MQSTLKKKNKLTSEEMRCLAITLHFLSDGKKLK